MTTGRVLIVDDDTSMCELLADGLRQLGFKTAWRTAGNDALSLSATEEFDAVVTDLNMPGMGGIEFCERVVARRRDLPVIVVTAFGSLETAIEAIRAGAYDFIPKPVNVDALAIALRRAIEHKGLRDEVKRLRRTVESAQGFEDIVGASPAMQKVFDLVGRIADSDGTVLLTGESGTGKEVVARAVHRLSKRSAGPFVAINCAAMPEALLESELFGHVKGAFTDARAARSGLFAQADGGTLLLDEIGDMPIGLQPKLLRALQERTVRPVGASAETRFDTRIIAATNRDLESAIVEKTFREDLYFRVNVIHIDLPPLRTRGGDALLLAQRFLQTFATRAKKGVRAISPAASERILAYSWPGNVRELQNCIERAVALARDEQLGLDDLPEKVVQHQRSHVIVAGEDPSELVTMEVVEKRYIARVLDAVTGNKTLAARILGFDRATLYRKIERYGITPPTPSRE